MFTGIVEELGTVVSRNGARLRIAATTVQPLARTAGPARRRARAIASCLSCTRWSSSR